MKIELKKLNALQHAVLPFSEVIDLKDEKMYGRNPTNTFRQRKVLKSLSKLITDMYEQAVMWNRMNRTFSARRKGPQSQSFALTHSSIQPERTETM